MIRFVLAVIGAVLFAAVAAPGQEIAGPASIPEHGAGEYRFDVALAEGERSIVFWVVPEPLWHRQYGDVLVVTGPPGKYAIRVNAIVGASFDSARPVTATLPVEVEGPPPPPPPPPDPGPGPDLDPDPGPDPVPTTWDGVADWILRGVEDPRDRAAAASSVLAGVDAIIAPPPGVPPPASGHDAAALLLDAASAHDGGHLSPGGVKQALMAILRAGDLMVKAGPDAALAARYAQALRPRLTEIAHGG